jgi:O-acetyl-ADP-ribose deacetylase (regulator of RNase III)
MQITYITGDATQPIGSDPRIIVHVCNDVGRWGRGFVVALSRRYAEPEKQYRAWSRGQGTIPFTLGQVQFVPVADELWVANLIGQHDIRSHNGVPPVRYEAIRAGLEKVAAFAKAHRASVHMPRIGAGLAGGDWNTISAIIHEELATNNISVTIYDLPT